jgi:hypothetical protein
MTFSRENRVSTLHRLTLELGISIFYGSVFVWYSVQRWLSFQPSAASDLTHAN